MEDEGREEVERLAEEFLERRRRGEKVDTDEYVATHPELAGEIREFFATLLFVEELGANLPGAGPASQAAGSAAVLQQVGEYRIIRELGRGGMGVVYEAEQTSLGRRVALKVLPFHSQLDSKQIARFQQEARAAARLSHPNIVPVYSVGEHQGTHYYVMQLIPGKGLNEVLEDVRRLRKSASAPPFASSDAGESSVGEGHHSGSGRSGQEGYFMEVARLVRDAALALDYAHKEGILHRDMKPSNLLLDLRGRVWVTDFGLAKAEGSDDLTQSGDFVGTIRYLAPERFEGWADPRSDIYGLGVTLYELLTLQPAFSDRDRTRLLRKVASENPPAPRSVDRSIPRDLETIVLKTMAKEPGHRYASARALAEELDRFLEGKPIAARRSTVVARLGLWCRSNPAMAALSAAVLILLVLVAAVSAISAVRLTREWSAGQEKLRGAYLAEAGALRMSGRRGRRFEALDVIRKAAEIRPGPDLVDEAVACFAQIDMREVETWKKTRDEGIAFSPDGSTIAVASPGGEVSIRAAGDGRELFRLPGPGFPASYYWSRFSPDGKRLAVRYEQGQRSEWKVWDLEQRAVRAEVNEGAAGNDADFAPCGSWVLLGARDGTLRMIDLETGTVMGEVGRGMQATRGAIHPGGRLIAYSSGKMRRVHIHDRVEDRTIRSLTGLDNQVFQQVAWHPDGRTLAAANLDHRVYVWDAVTGERSRVLQGHSAEVIGLGFDAGGHVLASAGWEPVVRFWAPGSDRHIFSLPAREAFFSRDGPWCWTTFPEAVSRWELTTQSPAYTLVGHEVRDGGGMTSKHPHSIAVAPGERLAVTAGDDGLRLWDLAARAEAVHLAKGRFRWVSFDESGSALYASGSEGLYRWTVRRAGSGGSRIDLGPVERLTSLAGLQRSSLGGGKAAVIEDSRVWLIDLADPERCVPQEAASHGVLSVALSADGSWAAAGSIDEAQVKVWSLRDGNLVTKVPGERPQVRFDPAGAHLAVSGARECTLWRAADWKAAWRIEREPGQTRGGPIAFDGTGKVVAITVSESRIWLLDAVTGARLLTIEAPEPSHVSDLALEGSTLAACAHARRLHVWNLKGLARDLAGLGLRWQVPVEPGDSQVLPRLRAAVLERSLDLLSDESQSLSLHDILRPERGSIFLRDLASPEDIDRRLAAPSFLIVEGGLWRYFRGRAEPSPEVEWTSLDFDDASWGEGPSPFQGGAKPPDKGGTRLADQEGNYTTLYLRHVFELAGTPAPSRLLFSGEVEDGLVAYLNGKEIGRWYAGRAGERHSYRGLATFSGNLKLTVGVVLDPAMLHAGRNVLALQVLTHVPESTLRILPLLAAVPAPDPERDRHRTEGLLRTPDGMPDPFIAAYRDGRVLQRSGRLAEALERFEAASRIDPGSAAVLLRRLAIHREMGEHLRAESLAREGIELGTVLDDHRTWMAWFRAALVDLRRSPAEALASLPRDPRSPPGRGVPADYRRLLEEISLRGAFRIDCGGRGEEADGKRWSRDCFFVGGTAGGKAPAGLTPVSGREAIHRTQRAFPGRTPPRPGYLIPLPPGRYRVSLHCLEDDARGQRRFDVILEGKTVLEDYEPPRAGLAATDIQSIDLDVEDGALDLDFLAEELEPMVAAIEIEALDATSASRSRHPR